MKTCTKCKEPIVGKRPTMNAEYQVLCRPCQDARTRKLARERRLRDRLLRPQRAKPAPKSPRACVECGVLVGKKVRFCANCRDDRDRLKARERSKRIYWSDPEYYKMKPKASRHGVTVGLLKTIMERDKTCQLCGSDQDLQFDHIHPRSEGGLGTEENLQLLCGTCNVFKSNNFFLPDGGVMINGD